MLDRLVGGSSRPWSANCPSLTRRRACS